MEYKPLNHETNEIRLLRLRASSHRDDEIQCNLSTVSLDSDIPQYEALSYVWGSPKE